MSDEYNYGPLEHQMAGGTDRSEFDQVFDQMEAPEYPATCDNCGEVGTNASMGQHDCSGRNNAPAAPERGDDGVNRYLKSEIEHLLKENSTLVTQRERLLEALKGYVTDKCNCYKETRCQNCETKALITTSEQEKRGDDDRLES